MNRLAPACAVAAVMLLCGCGGSASNGGTSAAGKETAALHALKNRYGAVVSGVDVRGTTAIVYVNVDQLQSMDEESEATMEGYALALWERAWRREHPRQHATLTVSVRDFTGAEIKAERGKV